MRHQLFRVISSLLITLLFLGMVANSSRLPLISQLEAMAYDTRVRLTMPRTADPRIVIVDIDERSLSELGHWPWPRRQLATLTNQLFEHYKIRLLGFDVVFAEAEKMTHLEALPDLAHKYLNDAEPFIQALETLTPLLDHDRQFAHSLADRSIVLGYYFKSNGEVTGIGSLPPPLLELPETALSDIPFLQPHSYGGNLPILQKNAQAAGYFDNPLIDPDGVQRRIPLIQKYGTALYDSLSLAMTRHLQNSPQVMLEIASDIFDEPNLEWLRLDGIRLPVDSQGAVLIPFRAPGSFTYIPAVDVLHGKTDPKLLKGKIVLLGTTALGLTREIATPVQSVLPGAELHANLISGMLDGRVLQQPGYVSALELLQLFTLGLLASLLLPRLSAIHTSTAILLLTLVTLGFNLYAWQELQMVLPIASSLLLLLILYLLHMGFGFFLESRNKRQIAHTFGQYVPPELVDELVEQKDNLGLEGEARELTVLFSDVRNFTTLSENLEPRELTLLMNEMLTPMTRIIHNHRGTIDKYMGDAIMAFWGAPLQDPEHARHALQAALEMQQELQHLAPHFKSIGLPSIRMGVGINTGIMNVGNMGSQFRMAYTVMGDAVNLGSRLEALTRQYGVDIIVGEALVKQLADFTFRELDRVRVKGKTKPVSIYEPIGLTTELSSQVIRRLDAHQQGLDYYRRQDWTQAETIYRELLTDTTEELLYTLLLKRITHYRRHPPGDDWDGAFTFITK
ncbi:MAG: adenylate/guanylate cyclase domain-containing protein [Sedimenticola sp.]